jgi:hypothetical protein
MYDMLMVLVLDIRALGSKDWNDLKVTKKLLRAFAQKDKNLTAMIRRDPRYRTMTPNQLASRASRPRCGEVSNLEDEQELSPQY